MHRDDSPILAVDTEDDSKGKVFSVAMTDGKADRVFDSVQGARRFFGEEDIGKASIWAHNLEYDLVNLFRGSFGSLRWQFYGGRLIRATLYGTPLTFRDSLNLLRMSLAAAGEIVGLKKLAFNPTSKKYVTRDARIVHKVVSGLRRYLRNLGGDLKGTIGASALHLWATRFASLPLPFLTDEVRAFFRRAYFGGRVEVFRYGRVRGRLSYVDVNSMFPYVMQGEFPDLWTLRPGGKHGVARARVKVPEKLDPPPLPYRADDGKVFYPVGSWQGVYCTNELENARRLGVKVRILERVGSDNCVFPFQSYVQTLYPRRKKSKNKAERAFLKLLLNSLYGKFGTAGDGASEIRSTARLNGKPYALVDRTAGFVKVKNSPPRYANVIWSAWITAAARVVLHDALRACAAHGSPPLYCDTDSIIMDGPSPFPDSDDLGAWKREGKLQEFHAKGPKFYYFRAGRKKTYRVKGVPRKKQREIFDTGKAVITRPIRLRESSRIREGVTLDGIALGPNIWIELVKEDRRPDPRRCVNKDGTTRPPRI